MKKQMFVFTLGYIAEVFFSVHRLLNPLTAVTECKGEVLRLDESKDN